MFKVNSKRRKSQGRRHIYARTSFHLEKGMRILGVTSRKRLNIFCADFSSFTLIPFVERKITRKQSRNQRFVVLVKE